MYAAKGGVLQLVKKLYDSEKEKLHDWENTSINDENKVLRGPRESDSHLRHLEQNAQ